MNHKRLLFKMVALPLVALIIDGCTTPQTTPTTASTIIPKPATTEITGLNPSPRAYVSMAYDAESDRVILFGGQTSASPTFNGETWVYDPTANTWIQMKPPSGPTKRCCADMVFDSESDRIILFGGVTDVVSNQPVISDETWAYDYNTNTWTERAKGPTGLVGDRLAYDAESDRVIHFGGYDMSGFYSFSTWAYDFNSDSWTKMNPSTYPSGRNYHAMAYDVVADRVIIWGGDGTGGDIRVCAYDYNKNTWKKIASGEGPAIRYYTSMVYNSKADRTILYGGYPNEIGDETWAYDYTTNTWTNLRPKTNPGKLQKYAMAYSTAADRVILFGGQENSRYVGQTWAYDFNTNMWTDMKPHP